MNNKILIFLCFVSLVFAQCSKKNTDMVSDTKKEMSEMKDKAVAKAKTWRSTAPTAGPARNIELGDYSSFDMDNGLKVIVVENHKLPRVSYQISLNNDALVEGDMAGYVSMAGDQMSKGTKNRTKAEIDEAIDFIGAAKTDPSAIASNVANIVNYGANHPYGEVQTEETVNAITLDKVKEFYNTYYKPNNAYLIVVGDTNLEEVKANARKYFGSWKKGNVPAPKYEMPKSPEATNVHFANKDGAVQSVIRVTYPIEYKPGNPDAVPASVMNSILGGGIFSGRLMQNLREDKAYTYGARSQLSSDQLIGNFNASASVRNEVTDSSGVIDYYDAYGNKLEMSDESMTGDITAEEIINNYIEALGGKSKLMAVKTMKTVMGMSVMGQDAESTILKKGNNKFKMVMSMGGNVMQESIYDGNIAAVGGMGGSQKITEGPQLDAMKEQAVMFGHLDYVANKTLELKGVEDVNGDKAYKVIVTDKMGNKSTEFFSMSTGYLVKMVNTQGEGEQVQVVTTELSDYKSIDGYMVPHKMTIIGAAPFPLNMEVKETMVNQPIPDTEFLIK